MAVRENGACGGYYGGIRLRENVKKETEKNSSKTCGREEKYVPHVFWLYYRKNIKKIYKILKNRNFIAGNLEKEYNKR